VENKNIRIMMLMGLTVPTVMLSRYCKINILEGLVGSLKMIRNTILVYFGLGLIIAPEIFSSKLNNK
jgi:hypothetical protein